MISRSRTLLILALLAGGPSLAAAQPAVVRFDQQALEQGRKLHQAGDHPAAEKLLAGVLAEIDRGALPQRLLGRCLEPLIEIYRRDGRHAEALGAADRYEAFLKNLQSNADVVRQARRENLVVRGDVLVELERWDDARQAYGAAITLARGDASARLDWHLAARMKLAELARRRGDEDQARELFGKLAKQATPLLARFEAGEIKLSLSQDAACVHVLATCLARTGGADEAIPWIERLAARQTARKELVAARYSQLTISMLHHMQAADLKTDGQPDQAADHWRAALPIDERFVADAEQADAPYPPNAVADARARLRVAYQELGRMTEAAAVASRLVEDDVRRYGPRDRRAMETKTILASLLGAVGDYARAKPLLAETLDYWRTLDPPDPDALASAWNNYAAIERATGDYDEAERGFEEALAIRERYSSPGDVRLAEARGNLASVFTAKGHYARAITLYQQAVEICQQLGPPAEGLLSLSLHNLAMAYKSQGQLDKAAEFGRDALAIQRRAFEENALGAGAARALADRYTALAAFNVGRRDFPAALAACDAALDICKKYELLAEPIAATVMRQRGTAFYLAEPARLDEAETEWRRALAIQLEQGESISASRTLVDLGDLAVRRKSFDEAEAHYRDALARLSDSHALPVLRYNALVNLAQLLYYVKLEKQEAVALLQQAVDLLETPRAGATGGESGRSEYFSRHAAAFDLLVDWSVENRRWADAFQYAERGRNRTFLDQLDLAGVDLRNTLREPARSQLQAREQQLSTQLASIRARAIAAAQQPNSKSQLEALGEELAVAEAAYAQVWRDIRDASPFYRDVLARERQVGSLDAVRQAAIGEHELMLFYVLGEHQSHLLLIGAAADDIHHFSLSIPPQWAATLEVEAGPITRTVATTLVNEFLSTVRNRDGGRGLAAIVASPKGMMDADRGAALTEVLLPREVRALVQQRSPQSLIVVPDGALHQMPLEALLIESQPRPRFLVDVFPPITYAPSAMIFTALADRQAPTPPNERTLLSAGAPAYPQTHAATADSSASASLASVQRGAFLDLGGVLSLLPGTEVECDRIQAAFGADRTRLLLGDLATEQAVRDEISARRFVHLAAHGLVDEKNENLFGAIALTPPATEDAIENNDGFLSLHEIHGLDLLGCDLAALSACQTNVGPERPLEAGSTLARAFLAAGARRVVSSHWNVDDEASSVLISTFFEIVAREVDAGQPVDYAAAMHQARLAIRNHPDHPDWAAPYYWAPFVLVGPPR